MKRIVGNFCVVVILLMVSVVSLGMDAGHKANHERPSDEEQPKKRFKPDVPAGDSSADARDVEAESRRAEFLAYQNKVRYFQNFRCTMERKFSYWGSASGDILDKLSALYLDKPSDKPGFFVIGSTPGVGKNTFAKHIREFLEHDPFRPRDANKGRFQIIKDRNKRIFDHDILKNTGSSERLQRGIHKIVVIDEVQAMTKDNGYNNATNELWFHAFGDAEINIDISSTISAKKNIVANAMRKFFTLKTNLNSVDLEIANLNEKSEGESTGEQGSSSLTAASKKKEELRESMGFLITNLTIELRELMNEVPDFFSEAERSLSGEMLARSFLDSDVATIERRFCDLPSYKQLYFDRNIYIFLGNPAKTNDEILEEMERCSSKTRNSLRALAKERLTEATVRTWFITHALHSQYYALNKRGWDSRMRHVFAIWPPASKHLLPLINASIESDFCKNRGGKIHIDDATLHYFAQAFADPTKDLRSLSNCYAPILTRMFDQLELTLTADHEPQFILEKQGEELVLRHNTDDAIKVTHRLKARSGKEEAPPKTAPEPLPEGDVERERYSIYLAYFYAFYNHLFGKFPMELYRVDDVKFEELYEDISRSFNLTAELSLVTLNLVFKYVGVAHFTGDMDRMFKKERVITSLRKIVDYVFDLKNTHSDREIDFIIKTALAKLDQRLPHFATCGMEIFNRVLMDEQSSVAMVVDGDVEEREKKRARPTKQEIVDDIYYALINFDDADYGINKAIARMSETQPFKTLLKGLYHEFLKSKKLTASFDTFGKSIQIIAAGNF